MDSHKNQPPRPSFPCEYCNQNFGRKEHLDRHVRRHLQLKPFKCILCTATFARKDTLARHSTVHGGQATEVLNGLASQSRRSAQACRQCAQSKQRCQGSIPCQRCLKKNFTCRLNNNGRKREKGDHDQHSQIRARGEDTRIHRPLNRISYETDPPHVSRGNADRPENESDAVTQIEDTSGIGLPTPEIASSLVFQRAADIPDDLFLHTSNNNDTAQDMNATFALDVNENSNDFLWTTPLLDTTSPLLWTYLDDIMPNNHDLSLLQTLQSSEDDAGIPRMEASIDTIAAMPRADEYTLNGTSTQADVAPRILGTPSRTTGLSFPLPMPNDHGLLLCEDFCHLKEISGAAYDQSKRFFGQLQGSQIATFPTAQMFHAFTELYFEHFDHSFPFVHPRQLEQENASWLLLVAVVSIGAQYSSISNAETYVRTFHALLERAILDNTLHYMEEPSLTLVQSVLIRDINLTFCGLRSGQTRLEYGRNLLFTLQVHLHSKRRRQHESQEEPNRDLGANWDSLVVAECHARLNYCIGRLQCLQLALFDLKPLNLASDLSHQELLPDAVWKCRTAGEWLSKYSSAMQKTTPPRFRDATDTMALLSEERLNKIRIVSNQFLASRLQRICSSTPAPRSEATIAPQNESTAQDRLQLNSKLLDSALAVLLVPRASAGPNTGLNASDESTLHIMSILRHVRLRNVYAFSGWQADEGEIHEARRHLQEWIDHEQECVRKCMWHAGSVFRLLRSKIHVTCFEPFNLLIAGLIIWTYCVLQPTSQIATGARLSANSRTQWHPVRIDQLTEHNDVEKWIRGHGSTFHLTGVGTLIGQDSGRRLMIELHKLLMSKTGWTEACRGIAFAVEQVLSGKRASLREEQERSSLLF